MTDYITQGSQRLWKIFTDNAFFANNVKDKNRVSFISGKPYPAKDSKGPGSFPEAQLRAASWQTQGFTGTNSQKTFGNTSPLNNVAFDFVIEKSVTYELILTYSGLDETLADKLVTSIEGALLNAGITLGIDKVKTWGPISGRNEHKSSGTAGGTLNLVQTISIPILFRLHRADVLGA